MMLMNYDPLPYYVAKIYLVRLILQFHTKFRLFISNLNISLTIYSKSYKLIKYFLKRSALHYNFGKKGIHFYISRVLNISRYYFLDNFMENLKKNQFSINYQFSVFTHMHKQLSPNHRECWVLSPNYRECWVLLSVFQGIFVTLYS
jgi:hypothetical protein